MEKPAKAPLAPPVAERDDVHVSGSRCPFCRTDVEREADQAVCRSCLARHHAACWEEAGACSACASIESLRTEKGSSQGLVSILVAVAGALTATATGVSSHDGLLLLLPMVSCLVGGGLNRSYRAVWQPPVVFLSSFMATYMLWVKAGNLNPHQLNAVAFGAIVLVGGLAAAAIGTMVANRLSSKA